MAYQPKSYRKYLAGAAAAAVVTSALPAAGFAAAFTDSIPTWAKDAVNYLVEKGAIEGYPDGTFGASKSITRAEAAAVLAQTLGLEIDETAKTTFADAKDHWASAAIAALQAQKEGVINGYEDGSFKPNNKITRQEMAKMVVEAYGLELDADQDVDFSDNNGWGKEFVNILASLGVVQGQGEGKFAPTANVTRAETAVFVHRAEVPEVRETPAADDQSIKNVTVLSEDGRYLAVEFAKAVGSVEKSEFTIAKANGERVGIESVSVSPDGKTVELVAYDADAQDEIEEGTEYIVTYKGNGETLSYTFERPNYLDDRDEARVTEVDAENGDFTVQYTMDDEVFEETIEVPTDVEFDYEAVVGAEIRVWFSGDNKLIKYEIADEAKIIYDAFEVGDAVDKANGEGTIELQTSDKEYDLSTDPTTGDINTVLYVDGDEVTDIEDLADTNYAKIVLNDKGDVAYIYAYNLESLAVVESVDGTVIEALGDADVDLEDFVIVKDGKTIQVSDLQKGDAIYYNAGASNSLNEDGYAVVYNNVITGNIETIYDDSFVVEGSKYDYDTMEYIDADGDLQPEFTKNDAEDYESEEVSIYVDYNGDIRLLTGVQEDAGNEVAAVLTATADVNRDFNDQYDVTLDLEYVTEDLKEEVAEVSIDSLDSITVDGFEYDIEQDPDEDEDYIVTKKADVDDASTTDVDERDVFVISTNKEGTVKEEITLTDNTPVLLTFDADGNVTDLEIFDGFANALAEDVEPDDSYAETNSAGDKKLNKDTVVFVAEDGDGTDAEDIEAYQFGDIDFDIDAETATVYYNKDGDAEAIVVEEKVASDTTEYIAVVNSYETTDGDVTRLQAFVNGVKTTYSVDDVDISDADLVKLAKKNPVKIVVNDESGEVESIYLLGDTEEFSDTHYKLNVTNAEVVSSSKFKIGEAEYQKGDNFQIIDATDSDLETETSLSTIEGKKIHVILEAEGSSYVSTIIILGDAPVADTTAPTVTVTSPTVASTVDAATFTITGATETGATVKVYADANNNNAIDAGETAVGTVVATAGTYSIAVPLAQGVANNFVVTSTDAAGNVSSTIDVATITDTVVVVTP